MPLTQIFLHYLSIIPEHERRAYTHEEERQYYIPKLPPPFSIGDIPINPTKETKVVSKMEYNHQHNG